MRRFASSVLAGWNQKSLRIFAVFLTLLIIWIFSWYAARWLIVEASLDHADAIVILSGSSTYFERAEMAAQLFQQGKANQIILTNDNRQGGWSSAEQRNPFFYERTKMELERRGVPDARIEVILEPVSSTQDEAERLRVYTSEKEITTLLIVTSPYHSRRALRTFRKVFERSSVRIGLAHPPTGEQTPNPGEWWFRPRGWEMVPYEYLKLVYYWLRA